MVNQLDDTATIDIQRKTPVRGTGYIFRVKKGTAGILSYMLLVLITSPILARLFRFALWLAFFAITFKWTLEAFGRFFEHTIR